MAHRAAGQLGRWHISQPQPLGARPVGPSRLSSPGCRWPLPMLSHPGAFKPLILPTSSPLSCLLLAWSAEHGFLWVLPVALGGAPGASAGPAPARGAHPGSPHKLPTRPSSETLLEPQPPAPPLPSLRLPGPDRVPAGRCPVCGGRWTEDTEPGALLHTWDFTGAVTGRTSWARHRAGDPASASAAAPPGACPGCRRRWGCRRGSALSRETGRGT